MAVKENFVNQRVIATVIVNENGSFKRKRLQWCSFSLEVATSKSVGGDKWVKAHICELVRIAWECVAYSADKTNTVLSTTNKIIAS